MKFIKQTGAALFVVLASIGTLPGCGKSNNAAVGVGGPVGVAATYSSIGLSGNGCYQMPYQYGYSQPMTLTFAGNGQVNPYDGSLQASLQGASVSLPGVNYSRSNLAGDSLQVYASGNTVYAVAYLAGPTVSYISQNFQNSSVCGLYINSPTSQGNITMSVQFISPIGLVNRQYISL